MTDPGLLLLGVDGGNTKAIALLARPDGAIIGAGRKLGCADIHATQPDAALAVLAAAVEDAGVRPGARVAAGFSLAGADWPEDIQLLREMVGERWPDATVVNDGVGALRAAIPQGPGVIVVCGTGAATAARGPDGRLWHSSFWQEPQGAHELGVKTLLRIMRADLGIEPPTALSDAVLHELGERTVEQVLHRWTSRDRNRRVVPARLARVLLDSAEGGDEAALDIVEQHGRALGRYAVAAARRVGIVDGSFTVALAGGVFRHRSRLLAEALAGAAREAAPGVSVVWPELPPVAGALLLAFDAAGVGVSEAAEQRIRATLPPDALFDTIAES